ncbi:MAG: helix-turn-helix domain-containing protein [Actinophytocola sp.]|nr:helix-turn-helix domain-containing protein [Actinophytocola sp.]
MTTNDRSPASNVVALETLWTTTELCAYLGITRDTLYEWREIGTAPPAFKLPNGQLRFPMSGVLDWLDDWRRAA